MTTEYTDRSEADKGPDDRDTTRSAVAEGINPLTFDSPLRDRTEDQGVDRPDFGSTRSDYGRYAYGGRLDERDLGSSSASGYNRKRSSKRQGYSGFGRPKEGESLAKGLLLLGGIGLGAMLMYMLDPDKGRRRRALVRDQITSASHRASKALRRTSRDLSNRAQGVVAEARKMLGLQEQTSTLEAPSSSEVLSAKEVQTLLDEVTPTMAEHLRHDIEREQEEREL
ncbi:MAG: hypothetical protein H0T92_02000 [Pyrinomonadaceae bacterium]|nr:hypothetical protein [Pyrinomonadaceae bacterium]